MLLSSELINTRRYLKQKNLLHENEDLFLSAFQKLKFNRGDKLVFKNLSDSIHQSEQILNEKSVVNSLMIAWINAQLI